MRSYTLDPAAAKSAGVGQRITESGKYVGRFTRAEAVKSQKDSEGVEFTFEAADGRTCDFLTCWTYNVDGKELYGAKVLNAVMTVCKLKTIAPQQGRVPDAQGGTREAWVFPALLAPVGLVLQREEYTKNTGAAAFKFNIVLPFEATSGLSAAEILERKTTPEQIDKIVAALKDKPMQQKRGGGSGYVPSDPGRAAGDPGPLDDDIPF